MAKRTTRKKVNVRNKFRIMRQDMQDCLIEREDEIDLVLVSILCKEKVNLVGMPGTAKSMLMDLLGLWVAGDVTVFKTLMTKHSVPEELFGPISVSGLKNDEYRRITTNKLPEAHFAVLDEIYKAGPGILNAMLRILNEGEYDNGTGGLMKCPLITAIGASNEWPEGEELGALFDRFLLRKTVRYVSRKSRRRLLKGSLTPELTTTITLAELQKGYQEAMEMEFADETWTALDKLLDALIEAGIEAGDRRMRKAVNVAKAYAWLEGDSEVLPKHLDILRFVLWNTPEQENKCHEIVMTIINPEEMRVVDLLQQAADVIANAKPTDAVPKLQTIIEELEGMSTERAAEGKRHVSRELKAVFGTVLGGA